MQWTHLGAFVCLQTLVHLSTFVHVYVILLDLFCTQFINHKILVNAVDTFVHIRTHVCCLRICKHLCRIAGHAKSGVGWAHFGESVTPDGMLCFPASFFIQPSWSGAGLGLGIRIVVGGRILKCTWGILQIWTKWKMSVLLLHHELFSLFWNNSLPNFPLPKMHQEAIQLTVFLLLLVCKLVLM